MYWEDPGTIVDPQEVLQQAPQVVHNHSENCRQSSNRHRLIEIL